MEAYFSYFSDCVAGPDEDRGRNVSFVTVRCLISISSVSSSLSSSSSEVHSRLGGQLTLSVTLLFPSGRYRRRYVRASFNPLQYCSPFPLLQVMSWYFVRRSRLSPHRGVVRYHRQGGLTVSTFVQSDTEPHLDIPPATSNLRWLEIGVICHRRDQPLHISAQSWQQTS